MGNTVDKVLKVAFNEVGYLEKKSNSQLDSKTANAGYNNYTKYARDLANIPGFYNGNKNGYAWCDVFVDWCFVQAYGVETTKKMLNHDTCGAGCVYSAQYFRNVGRFYSSPKIGDVIFFGAKGDEYHTGLVYDVDSSKVYTVEGNTSGAAGVVDNGGGVFKKSYSRNYSGIAGYGRPTYDEEVRDYLMMGDKGEEVKTMQANLIKLGYSCGSSGADGDFGYETENTVKKFQRENGLVADGLYGEASKAKVEYLLSKPVSNKIDTVKEVQNWANANYKSGIDADGIYGQATKKALVKILQSELNQTYGYRLDVDGIFGAKTKAACPELYNGSVNDVVGVLQALLICNGYTGAYLDKEYGRATTSAVKSYQSKNGLIADGIAGRNTFAKLCG